MIWIRITKSGGESLNKFFEKSVLKEDLLIVTPAIHNPQYLFYKKHIETDKKLFAIIRNPYDKAFSSYKWLTKNPKGMERCEGIFRKNISFTSFIKQSCEIRERFDTVRNVCVSLQNDIDGVDSLHYKEYWVVSHLESSFDSINFFTKPENVLLIPLEKMQEFAEGCVTQGVDFPNINKSKAKKNKLTKKERQIVENIYEKDFELYERAKEWKS